MPAGRPPKPNALKELAGNPGRRKLNGAEPKFATQLGQPPEFLSLGAKAEWDRVASELASTLR